MINENKKLLLVLIILFFIILNSSVASAQTFFWTDENGVKHFSDAPPASAEYEINTFKAVFGYPENTAVYEVLKVYDGDTIKVKGHDLVFTIRLIGIDAPETKKKKMPAQPFSKESKQLLERLLNNNDVMLKSYGKDRYNRQLAEIFIQNTNINLEMVKQGMAQVYRGKTAKSFDKDLYFEYENLAKNANLGIWRQDENRISPWQWRKKYPRK